MNIVPDWRDLIKHAWSVRLMILAGLLSGLEVALPFIDQFVYLPRGLMALLSIVAVGGGFVARIVAQKKFKGSSQ